MYSCVLIFWSLEKIKVKNNAQILEKLKESTPVDSLDQT